MNISDLVNKLEHAFSKEIEKTLLDLNNYDKIQTELTAKFEQMAITVCIN